MFNRNNLLPGLSGDIDLSKIPIKHMTDGVPDELSDKLSSLPSASGSGRQFRIRNCGEQSEPTSPYLKITNETKNPLILEIDEEKLTVKEIRIDNENSIESLCTMTEKELLKKLTGHLPFPDKSYTLAEVIVSEKQLNFSIAPIEYASEEEIKYMCLDCGDELSVVYPYNNTIDTYYRDTLTGSLTGLMHQNVSPDPDDDEEIEDWNSLIKEMEDLNDFFDKDKPAPVKKDRKPMYSMGTKTNEPEPKNNQGRDSCYICGKPTIKAPGVSTTRWDVCNNSKCKWYKS